MATSKHLGNLQEIHDVLIEIAHKAGQMMLDANPSTAATDLKNNSADLVTETDQAIEAMVSSTLKLKYPSYEFLGEETYKPGMQLTDAPTFICDPIDGTTNFVHGFPHVCISLGFSVEKTPVVGVVFNPWTATMYTAIKGQGSYVNKVTKLPRKSKPEPLKGLKGALVAVEWGSDRKGNNFDIKTSTFRKLAMEDGGMVHSLKSMGSAALNLCAVADGSIDVYWEAGCWAWDVCAGMIILREAGGIVVDGNPGNWDPAVDGRRYLAVRGAPSGQIEIIEEFWGLIEGRFDYKT